MRTAITLTRLHGEPDFQVTSGPDVPIQVQKVAVKQLASGAANRTHPEIAEVQLWADMSRSGIANVNQHVSLHSGLSSIGGWNSSSGCPVTPPAWPLPAEPAESRRR